MTTVISGHYSLRAPLPMTTTVATSNDGEDYDCDHHLHHPSVNGNRTVASEQTITTTAHDRRVSTLASTLANNDLAPVSIPAAGVNLQLTYDVYDTYDAQDPSKQHLRTSPPPATTSKKCKEIEWIKHILSICKVYKVFCFSSTVRTGSRTELNCENRFYWFRFWFQFSSAGDPSVRFSVLQKWLKNRTEPNFGNTSPV
ncbi:hypothetical protein BYT27DRAFT_7219551 [Phlegmacium glaucopus]|nr:hypothetical protein BYT27DRAFT_7219551 [Phlegmacium glaucopus]